MSQAVKVARLDTPANTRLSAAGWNWLYKTAAVCAVLMILIIPSQLVIFMASPPPTTIEGWFDLFQTNPLMGLLSFEALFILYGAFSLIVSLALTVVLWRAEQSLAVIFMTLTVVSTAALFAARPAFELLSLSGQYAEASTEAERAMFLAAGQAMLATFKGTAFQVSYFGGSLTGLLVSILMLRDRERRFSPATAYLRIASSLLDFALFIPVVGLYLSIGSVLCLFIWLSLVARRLFQLGQLEPERTL